MKLVTEFSSFTLTKGLTTKAALTGEGKSPEEIEAGLGEAFKFEAEKLKYFVNALNVADANKNNLKRVFVMTLGEGETAPAKATQVEDAYYVPEFFSTAKPPEKAVSVGRGGGGRGKGGGKPGGRGQGEKKNSSPWGESPEELAAKKAKSLAAKAAAAPKA